MRNATNKKGAFLFVFDWGKSCNFFAIAYGAIREKPFGKMHKNRAFFE